MVARGALLGLPRPLRRRLGSCRHHRAARAAATRASDDSDAAATQRSRALLRAVLLLYGTTRAMLGERGHVAVPIARVLAIAAVLVSYPYWWTEAAAMTDTVTHMVLTLPRVSAGLHQLMLYAVDGVALGGWQLVDLGLMALVAIELLSLIFLKVVIILLGALLYATGPITIGLVATESGAAIARAWASAVVMLLALPVAWATLFAVGALLVGRRRHGGPADRRPEFYRLAPGRGAARGRRRRVAVDVPSGRARGDGSVADATRRTARAQPPRLGSRGTDCERGAVELGELAAPFQRQRVPGGRRRRRSAGGRRPGWRDGGARRPCGRLCGAPRRARDRRSGGPSGSGGSCAARSSARRSLARRRRGRSYGESRNRQLAGRSARRHRHRRAGERAELRDRRRARSRRGPEQPATSRPAPGAPAVASTAGPREDSRPRGGPQRSATGPGVAYHSGGGNGAPSDATGRGNIARTASRATPATQPTSAASQVHTAAAGR